MDTNRIWSFKWCMLYLFISIFSLFCPLPLTPIGFMFPVPSFPRYNSYSLVFGGVHYEYEGTSTGVWDGTVWQWHHDPLPGPGPSDSECTVRFDNQMGYGAVLVGSAVGSWVWNFEFDQLICLGTL
eukprot:sb/3475530/